MASCNNGPQEPKQPGNPQTKVNPKPKNYG